MGESGTPHPKSGNWANRMKSIHGLRKRNKPLVEKKRRARINESLSQLKALVIESMQKHAPQSYSKLEKADILEMTVKHLKQLKQQINDREMASKYHVGYNECASQVVRYLGRTHRDEPEMHSRILDHLSNRMSSSGSYVKHQPPLETHIPPSPEATSRVGGSYESGIRTKSPSETYALSSLEVASKLESSYENRSYATNQLPLETCVSPSSEMASRLEGNYETTTHDNASLPGFSGETKTFTNRMDEKPRRFNEDCVDTNTSQLNRNGTFGTSRVGGMQLSNATVTRPTNRVDSNCDRLFYEDNTNTNTSQHNRNGMFYTSRVGEMRMSNATATRPINRRNTSCDQTQDNWKITSSVSHYQGTPLADIAPRDVKNRMPLSVNVNSTYAVECSSSAKGSLPPFHTFTQPFRQADRLHVKKYSTSEHPMVLSQNNMISSDSKAYTVQREITGSEYPTATYHAEESLASPNFIPSGMLDIGQTDVWRPW